MADETTEVINLIQGLKKKDARLYSALDAIARQLQNVYIQLNPLVRQALEQAVADASLTAPISFAFAFTQYTVRLTWSSVTGAAQYEIREGLDWDTADLRFRSSSLQGDIDPLTIGVHNFLIKAVTLGGVYSDDPTALVVTVPNLGPISISNQLIDNNVLLYWQEPTSSFKVDHYLITKDGDSLGQVSGTFFTRFETAAGTYVYGITAVDVIGNESAEGTLSVIVNAPPDFEITDSRVSELDGTLTDTLLALSDPFRLLASWEIKTFREHFVDNSWDTIQDQIDANYPIYIQPANTTGTYEEKVDYGTTITNIIVTVTWNFLQLAGETAVVIKMAVSADDITYSSFVAGASQFYSTFRYLKIKIEFTGVNARAIYEMYNLTFRLDVKREQDGGVVSAISTDVAGTPVLFNKVFKDMDAVTATPMGTADRRAIVDFTDVPNPTGFSVFLFNSLGVRVSGDVRWLARGIV